MSEGKAKKMVFIDEHGARLLRYDIKRDMRRDNESQSRYLLDVESSVLDVMLVRDEANGPYVETRPLIIRDIRMSPN